MLASMTINDLAAGSRVEMAVAVLLGRHLRLATMVRSQGAQSKSDSETGDAEGA